MLKRLGMGIADERGVALITAVMISMVVVTLGLTSVTLAVHNSDQSARDRRRVQGISAAEAGVNYYFSHLQSVKADQFECQVSQTLSTEPASGFEAEVTFYNAAGNEMDCPPLAEKPKHAMIRSVGSTSLEEPARTIEAYVGLVPIVGAPFSDTAVYSEGSPGFNSNSQIYGGDSQDGNVYTNGSATVNSNSTIHGSVFAQGSLTLDSNAEVKRDVWANGSVTMESDSRVLGDVTSSTSSVSLDSNAHVYGDARAGTTITTGSNSMIDGLRIPDSPSDRPPQQTFPAFTYDQAAWQEAGYSVQTTSSCSTAKSFIDGITGGNWVVRISAACNLQWTSNSGPTLRGHLAIISDGGLQMNSNSRVASDGGEHNLHLIFGLGGTSPCNITFNSNTSIATGLRTLLYTPCTINLNSNSLVAEGQIFGGTVNFNSNTSLTYRAIDVPGVDTGLFEEDIVYIREVVTE
jgi:cytoskeletal protein CcmA (bactofilin family)